MSAVAIIAIVARARETSAWHVFDENQWESLEVAQEVADRLNKGSLGSEYKAVVLGDVASERADIRSWLGQQAGAARASQAASPIANMRAYHEGAAKAFKEAADHLKPKRVKAGLAAKRAARKAGAK